MIELKHITKQYGERTVLNDISFQVEKGEVLGFLGPNGAGKTTTMRIITGYLSPSSGDVVVNGYDIKKDPVKVKGSIGYLPELAPAYPEMTVRSYLRFMAGIKALSGPASGKAVDRVLDQTNTGSVGDRIIGNLSRGYRQRVGIAQALLSDPPILILDEPTVGLDPEQIIEIRNLIHDLGKEHTVILSTHILPEVSVTCNRVIVIHDGRLLTQGDGTLFSGGRSREKSYRLVATGQHDDVLALLKSLNGVNDVQKQDNAVVIRTDEGFDKPESITAAVFRAGYGVREFSSAEASLEDAYIRLISRDRGGVQ